MKKSGILSLIFAFVLIVSLPLEKADAATTFTDVEKGYWAEEQINSLVNLEIVTGFEDGTFRPTKSVTREEAAIMLARALELDTTNVTKANYKDVNKDRYAYKYIAAVTKAGLMQGYNGKFSPTNPLTRQDMAVVLQNTFELGASGKVPFTDVTENYAYDAIVALYANKITTGYPNKTFKPTNATTREEFAVFLDRSLNSTSMLNYLKEVYANEAALASYEFEGSMNLGITLPEFEVTTPEEAMLAGMLAEMLGDIEVSMTGAYQLEPMLFRADITVSLKGEMPTTINLPIIMTEDKMWMKFPETPLMPLPEEIAGKYIEFDMAELAELSGQPVPTVDLNLQTEIAVAINDLVFDHFARGFYKEVNKAETAFKNNADVEKVVKFELTDETLVSFIDILFNKFMPDFVELLATPGYAEALGLTAEDVLLLQEGMAEFIGVNLEDTISEINNFVTINKFSQYDAIHKDKYILSNLFNMDIDFKDGEDVFGFKLAFDLNKSNVNEPVQIETPEPSEVVSLEEFESIFGLDEDFYYEDIELDEAI